MRSVLDLSYVKAFRYFMEPTNYCSMDLPIYINFKPVLDYVQQRVGNYGLKDILKDTKKMPSDYEAVNHKFLVKKDAKYTFRPLQITNPYLYYLLVKEMTNKPNWNAIKKRFQDFHRDEIEVSSIPHVKSEFDKYLEIMIIIMNSYFLVGEHGAEEHSTKPSFQIYVCYRYH